jgi:small subunit ribosomal protein S6
VKNYELTVVVRTDKQEETTKAYKEILAKNDVKIISEDNWGQKRLAYMIDGTKEGYYLFANIEAKPESVKKISVDFGLDRNILRHMFIVKDVKSA